MAYRYIDKVCVCTINVLSVCGIAYRYIDKIELYIKYNTSQVEATRRENVRRVIYRLKIMSDKYGPAPDLSSLRGMLGHALA